MKQIVVLMKNQFIEGIRSFKFWIMLFIFIFLGILSPATAKLMPTLMKSLLPNGQQITIPPVTQLDSWQQFFKNVGQMGLIVFLILYTQIFWEDIKNGSLVLFITKGVSRGKIIWSKWLYAVLVWTVSYMIAAIITGLYTHFLFKEIKLHYLEIALIYLWLLGICFFFAAVFFVNLFDSFAGGLLGVGVLFVLMMLMQFFSKIKDYSPIVLGSASTDLLTSADFLSKTFPALWITLILIGLCGTGTLMLFSRRQF